MDGWINGWMDGGYVVEKRNTEVLLIIKIK